MPARRSIPPEKQRLIARQRFLRARIAQQAFERQLAAVARQVGQLIKGVAPDGKVDPKDLPMLRDMLRRYSDTLQPWATSVAARMQSDVSQRDLQAWTQLSREIGRELRSQLEAAPVGMQLRDAMSQQVNLITSLPLRAAERVQDYAFRALTQSTRAKEFQQEILRTGQVTLFQAKMIARTETSKTASLLVQGRAEHIGSEGYFWRTARDRDVRPLHRKLEGKFIRWGDPPIAGSNGERAHAGQIYFCRCYPEPVIPDEV